MDLSFDPRQGARLSEERPMREGRRIPSRARFNTDTDAARANRGRRSTSLDENSNNLRKVKSQVPSGDRREAAQHRPLDIPELDALRGEFGRMKVSPLTENDKRSLRYFDARAANFRNPKRKVQGILTSSNDSSQKYKVYQSIGEGGMARVHVAVDESTETVVALKHSEFHKLRHLDYSERDFLHLLCGMPVDRSKSNGKMEEVDVTNLAVQKRMTGRTPLSRKLFSHAFPKHWSRKAETMKKDTVHVRMVRNDFIVEFKEAITVTRYNTESAFFLNLIKSAAGVQPDAASVWLVQEYCELGNLSRAISLIKRSKISGFTCEEVKHIAANVVIGLDFIHSKGIIHRDIKSSNILLTRAGRVKIADFGRSTFYDPDKEYEKADSLVTMAFMAPEMFEECNYGYEVDIWALGITLLELNKVSGPFDHLDDLLMEGAIPDIATHDLVTQRTVLKLGAPPDELIEGCEGENNNYRLYGNDSYEQMGVRDYGDTSRRRFGNRHKVDFHSEHPQQRLDDERRYKTVVKMFKEYAYLDIYSLKRCLDEEEIRSMNAVLARKRTEKHLLDTKRFGYKQRNDSQTFFEDESATTGKDAGLENRSSVASVNRKSRNKRSPLERVKNDIRAKRKNGSFFGSVRSVLSIRRRKATDMTQFSEGNEETGDEDGGIFPNDLAGRRARGDSVRNSMAEEKDPDSMPNNRKVKRETISRVEALQIILDWKKKHRYDELAKPAYSKEIKLQELLAWCLCTPGEHRPTAFELFEHPFLAESVNELRGRENAICQVYGHGDSVERKISGNGFGLDRMCNCPAPRVFIREHICSKIIAKLGY